MSRLLALTAIAIVLLGAAVLDVPSRLAGLAPAGTPTASASPTPRLTTDPGELTASADAENQGLDRCTPGSAVLARCGAAPDLGSGTWLGTTGGRPVRLDDLRGSVTLVDFFSISCLGCRQDLRYVRAWEERYRDAGLRVVGVHSPRIAVDRDVDRLAASLRRMEVDLPVLHDPSLATSRTYRTQVVPSTYLIGRDGDVRAITLGAGGHFRIEGQIRKLLGEGRSGVDLPDPVDDLPGVRDAEPGTTPQIDLARSQGRRYDTESDSVDGDQTRFRLPNTQPDGTFSLGGAWLLGKEASAPRSSAVARVTFHGRSAYQLVSGTGSLLVTDLSGAPRRIDVDGPADLVRIHDSAFGQETLTVRYDGDLQVYAFAFG